MGKRLKRYLKYIEHVVNVYEAKYTEGVCKDVAADTEFNEDDVPALDLVMEDLSTQIEYFQHERHMHLLVTLGFAIMTLMSFFAAMFMASSMILAMWIIPLVFLVLLIPYICHYYLLENGVIKLYSYRDRLTFLKH